MGDSQFYNARMEDARGYPSTRIWKESQFQSFGSENGPHLEDIEVSKSSWFGKQNDVPGYY